MGTRERRSVDRDLPSRVARVVLRRMPESRREWSDAMEAELASVSGRRARWGFAMGCVQTTMRQTASWGAALHAVAGVASLLTVLVLTRDTAYPPMRWGLVVMVAVLVAIPWLAHRVGGFGSVAEGVTPVLIRGLGSVLVGVCVLGIVLEDRSSGAGQLDRLRNGLPIFTAVLGIQLLGLFALTTRSTDDRALLTCARAGLGGLFGWLTIVALGPPLPTTPVLGLLMVGASGVVVAMAGPRPVHWGAVMGAASVVALAVFVAMGALLALAPDRWIPDLVPVAMTHSDDIAQSRVEALEPYLWLLLIGAVLAVGVVGAAWTHVRRAEVSPSLGGSEEAVSSAQRR